MKEIYNQKELHFIQCIIFFFLFLVFSIFLLLLFLFLFFLSFIFPFSFLLCRRGEEGCGCREVKRRKRTPACPFQSKSRLASLPFLGTNLIALHIRSRRGDNLHNVVQVQVRCSLSFS